MDKRLEKLNAQQRQQLLQQLRTLAGQQPVREPIAVVGIGCRFPGGCNSPRAYWEFLRRGGDAMAEVPRERWDIDNHFDANPDAPGKVYTRWFGMLQERIDAFDAEFFDIPPREARGMDPQQRLLLEVAWEALEDAAQSPDKLFGSDTGVFMGLSTIEFHPSQFAPERQHALDVYSNTGVNFSVAAGRIAYFLGCHGPALAIDTACSSSLSALHIACNSLRARECQLALAGGVSLLCFPGYTVGFCRGRMLAPDGPSKSFDAAANGYMRGEGSGVVVLKRLSDALFDRDHVYAVIRGSAVNQDGRSSGLTAPNGPAQQMVIRAALSNAGIAPQDVSYLEAHGTGTPLGDPIEVQAAAAVLAPNRSAETPLMLGSVKANIGHLEAAAGITGFIKLVLALHHNELPPQIHYKKLNPNIHIDGMHIRIPTQASAWPDVPHKYGGVSSFGFSGTNAHVICENLPTPPRETVEQERSAHVLTLSARTRPALLEMAARMATFLQTSQDSAADVAYSANIGRAQFDQRLAVVGDSNEQLRERLLLVPNGNSDGVRITDGHVGPAPRVAFMFTGQGCQYRGMGRRLYETQEIFRAAMDRCAGIIDAMLTVPLLETLYGSDASRSIDNTLYAQPCIFAVEYALAELWKSWGVQPAVVMGHSLGEYAAAAQAGAVTLEGALTLVAARARLSSTLPQEGEMAATMAGEAKLREVLGPLMQSDISVAAFNGPDSTVISGKYAPMKEALAQLAKAAIRTQVLAISNSFHSPSVEPMLPAFVQAASDIQFSPVQLPLVSNLTGDVADEKIIGKPDYWGRHLREPVQFFKSVQVLRNLGVTHFIEVGPKPTLLSMGRKCVPEYSEFAWLASLKPDRDDWQQMFESLGALYVAGLPVDLRVIESGRPRYRVSLPTYPFQRQPHSLERVAGTFVRQASQDATPALPPVEHFPDMLQSARQSAQRIVQGRTPPTGTAVVEKLSAMAMAMALGKLEAFSNAEQPLDVATVVQRGRIAPQFTGLIDRWLPELVRHNLLRAHAQAFGALNVPSETAFKNTLAEAQALWSATPAAMGWNTQPLTYLQRCATRLPEVLRGGDALQALFADDYFGAAATFYENAPDARLHNQLAGEVLQAWLRTCAPSTPLRVLEIGGGSGGMTSAVLPCLPQGRTSYVFTDTSSAFFARANSRFGSQLAFTCSTLDIGQDPAAQGYAAQGFDVIIASNVLHATPHLQQTLQHVHSLLRPGGMLLLNEVTTPTLWYDLLFGPLLPVLQKDTLRSTQHLLSPTAWQQGLTDLGWRYATALPQGISDAPDAPWWSIVVAEKPGVASAQADARPGVVVAPPAKASRAGALAVLSESLRGTAGTEPARLAQLSLYLQTLVADIVGISDERMTPELEFVGLGMDSLMAMELSQRIEQDLSKRLPIAALAQASSLPRLVELLSRPAGASALDSCLVELHGGPGAALSLVHPSGGGILCYSELARGLQPAPVLAFQAQGLLEGQRPHDSIEAMAQRYMELLRERQPEGPYALAGWSLGGVVAFEMAQQLHAAGCTVPVVMMIDSWLPTHMAWPQGAELTRWFIRDMAGLQGAALTQQASGSIPDDIDGQLSFMIEFLKSKKIIPAVLRPNHIRPQYDVFRHGIAALAHYRPQSYPGAVRLVRATQRAPEVPEAALMGWQGVARDFASVDVVGNHFTIMQAPAVHAVAATLQQWLSACRG